VPEHRKGAPGGAPEGATFTLGYGVGAPISVSPVALSKAATGPDSEVTVTVKLFGAWLPRSACQADRRRCD
jgi:hypothetical protein